MKNENMARLNFSLFCFEVGQKLKRDVFELFACFMLRIPQCDDCKRAQCHITADLMYVQPHTVILFVEI